MPDSDSDLLCALQTTFELNDLFKSCLNINLAIEKESQLCKVIMYEICLNINYYIGLGFNLICVRADAGLSLETCWTRSRAGG